MDASDKSPASQQASPQPMLQDRRPKDDFKRVKQKAADDKAKHAAASQHEIPKQVELSQQVASLTAPAEEGHARRPTRSSSRADPAPSRR